MVNEKQIEAAMDATHGNIPVTLLVRALTAAEQAEPAPAALEPTEPATDAEPVAVLEFARKQPGNENEMPRVVSCNWLPDGQYKVYTHPPESRLREAMESIANNTCCSGCQEAALVARAALAQEDGR